MPEKPGPKPSELDQPETSEHHALSEKGEVRDIMRPVLQRTYELESGEEEFEEIKVHVTRTSGRGSYAEAGYVPEGAEFDPRDPTRSYPKEWHTKGGYSYGKSGPGAHSRTEKVRVPRGVLCYQAGGSGSGYNRVRFFRAGMEGIEYRTRLPMGWRPEDVLAHYPKGSYVALPGEAGVGHPEYKPPWLQTWRVDYHGGLRTETLLLLKGPEDKVVTMGSDKGPRWQAPKFHEDAGVRWVSPTTHPCVSITKESSRRGAVQGEARLETRNPDGRFALVRDEIGEPWKVTTWREVFETGRDKAREIPWGEFVVQYKEKYGVEPPPLPKVEEVLERPERPFEEDWRSGVLLYAYRTEDGKLVASPAKPTGKGRSRKFRIFGKRGGAEIKLVPEKQAEEINEHISPINDGELTTTGEWWEIPEEGVVNVQMTYASGNLDGPVRVSLDGIPEENGLYAVWYKEGEWDSKDQVTQCEHVVIPTSFRFGDRELVAVEPYETWTYVSGKRPLVGRDYRHKSEEELTKHSNQIIRDAALLYDTAAALRETWVQVTEEGGLLPGSEPEEESSESELQ